jgi:alpha-amylase/alpha-mannosidase (GH57 family)
MYRPTSRKPVRGPEIKSTNNQALKSNHDMNQQQLATEIKAATGATYSIQGWNIYLKSSEDIAEKVVSILNDLNEKHDMGYKRFGKVKKDSGRVLITSVPFGIALTIN